MTEGLIGEVLIEPGKLLVLSHQIAQMVRQISGSENPVLEQPSPTLEGPIYACAIDHLKFELCEDLVNVGKKAASASDNKASVFFTPLILRCKAVAGLSGLKKQQNDFTLFPGSLVYKNRYFSRASFNHRYLQSIFNIFLLVCLTKNT